MERVELLCMHEWGHLVGTVRCALQRTSTPFVLLHQHDLLLSKVFSPTHALAVLRALAARTANYVLLNRDVNFAARSTQYLQAAPHQPQAWRTFVRSHAQFLDGMQLTPFVGFSDQTHFARAGWLRERVLPMVGDRRRCCMEFAVHEIMLLAWLRDPRRWERTFVLGGMADGPFIYDSQKNGCCWAGEVEAYSEEMQDEVYVCEEDRMRHVEDANICLALYVCHPPLQGQRSGRIVRCPDTDAHSNRTSRDRFSLAAVPNTGAG
eukprot:NODE_8813_length_1468_cov_4.702461.p1 GENE.NODE_8813_length_1468_cov_4.702461~~NODE_8813_length_1468_cov_4.702461.p1  ORF type:complete len:282 (-),score=84.70 NODE_8813_length_1468_cov_4.702461:622-1413(-)